MSHHERLDVVIVGAGVIGLAVARVLSQAGRDVVVLEAERAIGAHSSSRNSEVIHAGIYYPTGTLKARLCVAGRKALYAYCWEKGVAHAALGKLIVATREEEIPVLEKLKAQAEANGVGDLSFLDAAEVRALEPAVRAVRALLSPSTGIVDSHGLMTALRRDAETAGVHIVLGTPVLSGKVHDHGIELAIGGPEPTRFVARTVVNAAGLRAQELSRTIEGLPQRLVPPSFFAKGHYFALSGRAPVSRLVYPVPVPGGLGIHITLDLAGQARFGPDVGWVDAIDYDFDDSRASAFYAAIRTYLPTVRDGQLVNGYTGIRPKLGPASAPAQDFVIHGPESHGVPNLVNLYGIESPGLTASLALADHVARLLT